MTYNRASFYLYEDDAPPIHSQNDTSSSTYNITEISNPTTSSLDLNKSYYMNPVSSVASLNSLFDINQDDNMCKTVSSTTTVTPKFLSSTQIHQPQQLITGSDLNELINKKFNTKTIIMLVGLPASGKSTISKQLLQHFQDNLIKAKIYNAGNIRRNQKHNTFSNAEFFNPNNESAKQERESYATMTMENLLNDLDDNKINVGFLDATNTTRERRSRMMKLIQNSSVEVNDILVLDVRCSDERLIDFNINGKAFNPDYQGKDHTLSIKDFKQRTNHYFKVYEPITTNELQSFNGKLSLYAKIVNGGKDFKIIDTSLKSNYYKKDSDVIQLFSQFVKNYYANEGERYYEAVNAFYSKVN